MRYRKPRHVGHVVDGDATLVENLSTGERLALPARAGEAWHLLVELGAVEPVVDVLVARHGLPADVADVVGADVRRLVADLVRAGLLEPTE